MASEESKQILREWWDGARKDWFPIDEVPPPRHEMFIWGYWKEDRFSIGLAYWNVSGKWSCAYQSEAPEKATHWAHLPEPPPRGKA